MSCRPARSRLPAPGASCSPMRRCVRPISRADGDGGGDLRRAERCLSRPYPTAVRRCRADDGAVARARLASLLADDPLCGAARLRRSLPALCLVRWRFAVATEQGIEQEAI